MAPTVALLSPGAMGAVVGQVLRQHGATVITSLEGRSEASAARAREAGLEAVSDDDELVDRADLLLSILVPAEVVRVAERVAAAVKSTGSSLVFVDCNAVAPHTGRQVADIVAAAGGPKKVIAKEFKYSKTDKPIEITLKAASGKTLLCGVELLVEKK